MDRPEEGKKLEELLAEYARSGAYPFHMPGHKRQPLPGRESLPQDPVGEAMKIDITEISGFDDLHAPEGILLSEMRAAAKLYGVRDTLFSVNGTTASNLAAVFAAAEPGGRILVASNCHRSIFHAASLRGLKVTVLPVSGAGPADGESRAGSLRDGKTGSVSGEEPFPYGILRDRGPALPEDVAAAFRKEPDIRCVVLTSPTYDGVISDVSQIAEIVHSRGAVLVVDEAHGAHLPFFERPRTQGVSRGKAGRAPEFPVSAIRLGADLVAQSLHKTLPAMTQTSLLHNVSGRIGTEELRFWMDHFVSSSPSYVLMASITRCLHFLAEEAEGGNVFSAFRENLAVFRNGAARWQRLRLLAPPAPCDPSRLLIGCGTTGYTGTALAGILRENYNIETELAMPDYVLAITGICDTEEGFARLSRALREIDAGQ